MTAVFPPQSNTFNSNMSAPGPSSPTQEPTPPEHSRHDDDLDLTSHELKRENTSNDAEGGAEDEDDALDNSSNAEDGPSRKRRRSRKGLDKKFECPHEGCGKSYSRAEHLFVQVPFWPIKSRELIQCTDTDIN